MNGLEKNQFIVKILNACVGKKINGLKKKQFIVNILNACVHTQKREYFGGETKDEI